MTVRAAGQQNGNVMKTKKSNTRRGGCCPSYVEETSMLSSWQ